MLREAVGNPGHVKMAGLADWISCHLKEIDEGQERNNIVEVSPAARTAVTGAKQIIGAVCVYNLILKQTIPAGPDRITAVDGLRKALKSSKVELHAITSARTDTWAAESP